MKYRCGDQTKGDREEERRVRGMQGDADGSGDEIDGSAMLRKVTTMWQNVSKEMGSLKM